MFSATLTSTSNRLDMNMYNTRLTQPSEVAFFDQDNTWPALWIYHTSLATLLDQACRAAPEKL